METVGPVAECAAQTPKVGAEHQWNGLFSWVAGRMKELRQMSKSHHASHQKVSFVSDRRDHRVHRAVISTCKRHTDNANSLEMRNASSMADGIGGIMATELTAARFNGFNGKTKSKWIWMMRTEWRLFEPTEDALCNQLNLCSDSGAGNRKTMKWN